MDESKEKSKIIIGKVSVSAGNDRSAGTVKFRERKNDD